MTYSHTMQELLPDRPTHVSALALAGERKEIMMSHAMPEIVVGFAGQPYYL